MSGKMISVGVLLAVHNRKEKTIKCLRNLFKQNGVNELFSLEVFLTDDASTDGTDEAVKCEFPSVSIIAGNGNLYWNRGMHLAWNTARQSSNFDYYLWLNDDTDLKDDAVVELVECAQAFDDEACVCGAIRAFGEEVFSYGGRDEMDNKVVPNGTIQHCKVIHGNCVLVSKKITDAVGVLDPVFPHAIGDHDYGLRVLAQGYKLVTTRKYVGFCDQNAKLPKWCYGNVPIIERFRSLYSPLGYAHPKYFYIYESRHFGHLVALKHYFSIHLRVIMPSLWK